MSNIAASCENAPDSGSLPLAKFFETAAALAVFNTHRSMSCPETIVRRDRDRLDPSLRMLPRVSAEESQPRSERHLPNAETDHAVCDIGRKVISSAALDRRRTDGARHVSTPMRVRKNRKLGHAK
jgi:hypothetical protein